MFMKAIMATSNVEVKQMEAHKIYETVEKRLKEFAEGNHGIFENMMYGQVLQVYKDLIVESRRICHPDMFAPPYNIKYFGKLDSVGGDLYVFLDGKMDKVYTYVAKILI